MAHCLKLVSIAVLLQFLACLAWTNTLDFCGPHLFLHSNYKIGERLCCVRKHCPPGTEGVICSQQNPNSTSCRTCPSGSYQPESTNSDDSQGCILKRVCHGGQRAKHKKSRIRNTECFCDPARGLCNSSGNGKNPLGCVKKTCPDGYQLLKNCSCILCSKEQRTKRADLDSKFCDENPELCLSPEQTGEAWITECPKDTNPISVSPVTNPVTNPATNNESSEPQPMVSAVKPGEQVSSTMPSVALIVFGAIFLIILICVAIFFAQKMIRQKIRSKSLLPSSGSGSTSSDNSMTGVESAGSNDLKKTDPVRLASSTCPTVPIVSETQCKSFCMTSGDLASTVDESRALLLNGCDATDGIAQIVHIKDCDIPREHKDSKSYVMREKDKVKLNVARVSLVKSLLTDETFWAMLQSNGTITEEAKSNILNTCNTNEAIAGALIDYLEKRDSRAFTTFVAALICADQEHLAKKLDQELTEEINRKCETTDQLSEYVLRLEVT